MDDGRLEDKINNFSKHEFQIFLNEVEKLYEKTKK